MQLAKLAELLEIANICLHVRQLHFKKEESVSVLAKQLGLPEDTINHALKPVKEK